MDGMSDYGPMEGWEWLRALDAIPAPAPGVLEKWVADRRRVGVYGEDAQLRQIELDEKERGGGAAVEGAMRSAEAGTGQKEEGPWAEEATDGGSVGGETAGGCRGQKE